METEYINCKHQEGDETLLGIIEAVSLTAYLIDGRWVSHKVIDGKAPIVNPLIQLRDF